jgi:hypothetical protein
MSGCQRVDFCRGKIAIRGGKIEIKLNSLGHEISESICSINGDSANAVDP